MNTVDELKQRLVDVWRSLQQSVIDAAVNEWRKRLRTCTHVKWQMNNILSIYCELDMRRKSDGQIKSKFTFSETEIKCNLQFSDRCFFTAQFVIFGVLMFSKVRHVH